MTTSPPSRRWLLLPLLAALATRLACLPLAKLLPHWGDANGYLVLAREFRETGQFGVLPSGVRPPIARILMALGLDASALPADPFPGVFLVQILAGLLACALLMILTRRRFGTRAALATGWIYALYPPAVLWSAGVLMVEVFAVAASAAVLLALDALDRALGPAGGTAGGPVGTRVLPRALVLGLLLGLGILTKEQMLAVTAVTLLVLVLRPGLPVTRRLGLALVVGVAVFAVTLPWGRHNLRNEGAYLVSGSYGNLGLMLDNAPPGQSGMRMWVKQPSLPLRMDLARSVFRRALTEYPGLTARRAWMRLRIALGPEVMLPIYIAVPHDGLIPTATENLDLYRDSWTLPPGSWGRRTQLLCGIAAVLLFSLSAAGLAAAPRSVLTRETLLMTGVVLLSAALFVAAARYRQSLIAFHLPFAGLALAGLTDRQGRAGLDAAARRRALAWGLGVAVLLTLMVFVLPVPAVPTP